MLDPVEAAIGEVLVHDHKILVHVRKDVLFSRRQQFLRELHKIFIDRCSIPNATMTDCWVLYYAPGDYYLAAKAAGIALAPDL